MAWTAPRTWAYDDVPTDTMLNAHLRDNLLYVKGQLDALANIQYVTNQTVYTTVGTTWADFGSGAPFSITFTPTSASNLIVMSLETGVSVSGATNVSTDISIDSTRIGDATYGSRLTYVPAASQRYQVSLTYVTTLSVAAHTINPMWRCDSGGVTVTAGSYNRNLFMVRELAL